MRFKDYFQLCEARLRPQPQFGTPEYMKRSLERHRNKVEPTGFVVKVVYTTGNAPQDPDEEKAIGQTALDLDALPEKMLGPFPNIGQAIHTLNHIIQDRENRMPLSASIWEYGRTRRIVALWQQNKIQWNKEYERYAPYVHLKHSLVQANHASFKDHLKLLVQAAKQGDYDDEYDAAHADQPATLNIRKPIPKTVV